MTQPRRIPDGWVERVHLGQATEDQTRAVLADPDARNRLDRLPAADASFLEAHPADQVVPDIERRAHLSRVREDAKRRSAIGVAMVMAPLLAVFLGVFVVGMPDASTLEPTTTKGVQSRAKLRVYRVRSQGIERLSTGAIAREGDVLQLGVLGAGAPYGAVVSVDSRRSVTLHFPSAGQQGALDEAETPIPTAYELDDAPDYERFFLVTSERPVDTVSLLAAAKALPDPRVDKLAAPGLAEHAFLLRKEEK